MRENGLGLIRRGLAGAGLAREFLANAEFLARGLILVCGAGIRAQNLK